MDLVIILDGSGSVSPEDFERSRFATANIVKQLNVSPTGVRVGLVSFASTVSIWQLFVANEQLKSFILGKVATIPKINSGTDTAEALSDARTQVFSDKRNGIYPRVAIIFTDGASNYPVLTQIEATKLKDEGVYLYAIGIGSGINNQELEDMASEPKSTYKMTLQNFAEIFNVVDQIIQVACETPAFLPLGVSAKSEPKKDEINYYQTDTSKLGGSLIEFEVSGEVGAIKFAYSFSSINPTFIPANEANFVTRINNDGTQVRVASVAVPLNAPKLYISTQGIQDTNKYILKIT